MFQLEALKRTVDRTATDLEVARSEVTHLKKEASEKLERFVYTRTYMTFYRRFLISTYWIKIQYCEAISAT